MVGHGRQNRLLGHGKARRTDVIAHSSAIGSGSSLVREVGPLSALWQHDMARGCVYRS